MKLILGIILFSVLVVGIATIPSVDAAIGKLTIRGESSTIYSNESVYYKGKLTDSEGYAISFERITIWEWDNTASEWQHVAQGTTDARGEYKITIPANHWNYAKTVYILACSCNSASAIESPSLSLNIEKPYKSLSQTSSKTDFYVKDTTLLLELKITKLFEKNGIIELKPIVMSDDGYKPFSKNIKFYVNGKYIGTGTNNEWYNAGVYSYGSYNTFTAKYPGDTIHFIDYRSSSGEHILQSVDKTLTTKHTTSSNSNLLKNTQSTHSSTQYKDSTYNLKSKYYDLLQELESGIKLSKSTLSGLSFENHDAQKKIEFAWDVQYETLAYVDEGKNILKQMEVYLKNHNYQKAWTKLHQFDKQPNLVKTNMYIIITEIKESKELEESFQEKNKSCFLFWCSISDTTKGLDNKITKLELKTEKIKNKQKDVVNDYQNIVYEQKLTKQKDDSKKEQEILKKEQKAELKQQQILAKQEQQRLEQEQRQTELRAKQEQQRLEQEQRQTELDYQRELEQKQKIQREKNKIILHAQNMPLVKGWMNGELTYYVEKLPSYVSQNVQNSVESLASQIDGKYINGVKMKRVYSWGDINVNWTKEYKEEAIGQMFGGDLFVGLGNSSCGADWKPFDGTTVKRIMYHEIGHAMGQSHNSDFNNVMYKTIDTRFEYDYDERTVLSDGYWQQIFFCNTGKISFSTEVINESDAGYKVYVLGNNGSPKDVIQQKGAFYPDCSGYKSEYYSFGRSCNVENGSSLVIYNPSRFNTGDDLVVNVKMINNNPLIDVNYTFEYDSRFGGLTQDYKNQIKQLFG